MTIQRHLVSITLLASAATAQCTSEWLTGFGVPGANSLQLGLHVRALAIHDPDGPGPAPRSLILGGSFRFAGNVLAHSLATFDPRTGRWSEFGGGLGGTGYINEVLSLPTGDLVAAGNFAAIGGVQAANIARWDGTGWHALGTGTDDIVEALGRQPNGDLLAGGSFLTAGGVSAHGIARWDGSQWSPLGGGFGGTVHALTVRGNGNVVAAGTAHSSPTGHIAEWDGSTWSQVGTSPPAAGIKTLVEADNGDLVAGGRFALGGVTTHIARFDGVNWSALGNDLNQEVGRVFVLPGGDIVAGGLFGASGTTALDRVARWNGTAWSRLTNGPDLRGVTTVTSVRTFAIGSHGELYCGGLFDTAGGQPAVNVAALQNGAWAALSPGTSTMVLETVARHGDGVVIGGIFTHIQGVPSRNIARYDDGTWSALGAGLDGNVLAATELQNGDLVAGGLFTQAGNTSTMGIARWDGTDWHALAGSPGAGVGALDVAENGDLLVGLNQGNTGGAVFRFDGATWTTLPGLTGSIRSLVVRPNDEVIVAGALVGATVAGNQVARWDGNGWSPLAQLTANLAPRANRLALTPAGDVILGGAFLTINGAQFANVARWDGTAWQSIGTGISRAVEELSVLPTGDIVIATAAWPNGLVSRWSGTIWSPIAASLDSRPGGMDVMTDGTVVLGGSFRSVGSQVSSHIAMWQPTCPATATELAPACPSTAGPMNLRILTRPWLDASYRLRCSGMAPSAIAAAVIGLTAASTPLSALHPTGVMNCDLRASPDVTTLLQPVNGTAALLLPIAANPALVGTALHTQVLQLEISAQSNPLALSASNALRATVGTY